VSLYTKECPMISTTVLSAQCSISDSLMQEMIRAKNLITVRGLSVGGVLGTVRSITRMKLHDSLLM